MVTTTDRIEERTERSRNAKAQARHRAKRKAYIEHLEQSVARLQAIVGLPSADPADSPLARLRELENENARLRAENAALHRQLVDQDDASSSAARALQDANRAARPHQAPPPLLMPLYSLASPISEQRSPGTSSTTSSSAASPFSSSASPLTLPGLKLPPAQTQGQAIQQQQQQQQQPESPGLTSPTSPYAHTTYTYTRNTYDRGAFDLKPEDGGISSYASSAYGLASPAMTTQTSVQPPHSYALYSPHDLWGGPSRVHVVGRS
jgi:hypothetical protein